MLGFIIVIVAGVVSGAFATREFGNVWGMICGIAGALLIWAVLGLILRKRIAGQQQKIQEIMQTAQNKVNRQMEMFQRRPPSSEKAARQIVEKIQFDAVRKALAELENGNYTYEYQYVEKFGTNDYIYTLTNGAELQAEMDQIYAEFSNWLGSWEM
jgi:predicted PurR-regulated permease PerM